MLDASIEAKHEILQELSDLRAALDKLRHETTDPTSQEETTRSAAEKELEALQLRYSEAVYTIAELQAEAEDLRVSKTMLDTQTVHLKKQLREEQASLRENRQKVSQQHAR